MADKDKDKGIGDIMALRKELFGLFGYLQKIRKELASLNSSGTAERFNSMSEELDEIVKATERATDTIMTCVENIDNDVNEARALSSDPALGVLLDRMNDNVNQVFEACSFQDITGQRVTKVVGSLKFVEERVHSVILTWGKDEIEEVVEEIKEEHVDPEKKLLNGPAMPGQGVSQKDVDSILAQNDIDALFA